MAGQPGDGRRLGTRTADVADGEAVRAVADREDVVEVAADLVALARRAVDDLDLDVRHIGETRRQEAALEGLADRRALRVQAGVVQGQSGPAGQVLGQLQDLLAEVVVRGLPERQHADHAVAGDQRQDHGLTADRLSRGERGPGRRAHAERGVGGQSTRRRGHRRAVPRLRRRGPDTSARGRHRIRRGDLRQEGLEPVDEVLVLVEHVREVRVRGLVRDRVHGAPGGQGRDRHLCHEGQCLVPVERAGQQVGRLDEEGQGTAAQPFQLAEAGGLHRERDAVRGELETQGLLVGVAAGVLRRDAERAREPSLDLQRDRDDRAHPRVGEQRDGAGNGGQVLVHRGHPGGAVAPRAGLHGDPGEPLAGRGEARRRADLQLRLVVRGEQEEGGVRVEHVPGPLHRPLQEAVQVVGGGRADEDLERVRRAVVGGDVGDRRADRALEDGALVVADEQADRRRVAVVVADPQVRGVHGDGPAVGAADPVAALPAGELEGVGDARTGARGVRPGHEVGELLAGDLLRGVPEHVRRVFVPGADRARAVDLDDGDPDPLVGHGEQRGRQDRARRADPHRTVGQVQLEPDVLAGGAVLDTPAGGQGRTEEQPAAVLTVGAAEVDAAALERHLAFRIVVGDLDADALRAAQAQHVGRGAGVDDGVGHELTGENDGVVDDIVVPPPLERVPDKGAGGRDRAPDRFERGGRARGDHSTPHMVSRRFPESCARFSPLRLACQARPSAKAPDTRGLSSGQVAPAVVRGRTSMDPRRRGWGSTGTVGPATGSGLVRCNDLTSARLPVDGVRWR